MGPWAFLGGFYRPLRVPIGYIVGIQGSQGQGPILGAHGFILRLQLFPFEGQKLSLPSPVFSFSVPTTGSMGAVRV